MADSTIHVHVKRRNQTYVITCATPEQQTIGYIKSQIAKAVSDHVDDDENDGDDDREWTANRMRLLLPKRLDAILEDDDTLDQHNLGLNPTPKLPPNAPRVLYVVFQLAENEWESVDVEPLVVDESGGGGN